MPKHGEKNEVSKASFKSVALRIPAEFLILEKSSKNFTKKISSVEK